MPDLLHEYWEDGECAEFGLVHEHRDLRRPTLFPNARFVFSIMAGSWFQAMQAYQERMGYGDYVPPDDVPDHFYTAAEQAEQEEYLRRRQIG